MAGSMSDLASVICERILSVFTKSSEGGGPPALDVLTEEIGGVARRGARVFVHGVGREGLMMKALCMRLAHLGIAGHCVGDMTTPPIGAADLLVASAGPGGFPTVDAICAVARSTGARVLVLTSKPETGSASQYAHAVAVLAARTMAEEEEEEAVDVLPMGSAYEGAMFVLFEMVVFRLSGMLGQTPRAISARHTNLE